MSDVLDSLDLNSSGYNIVSADYGGAPNAALLATGGGNYAASRLVRRSSAGSRTVSYEIDVEGSSEDDLRSKLTALLAKLPLTTQKSLVVTRYGATASRTLTALAVTGDLLNAEDIEAHIRRALGYIATVKFSLLCAPWAYGSEVTLLSASAQTAPLVLSLGTVTGDYPAPLDLLIAKDAAKIHSCFVGVLKAGSSLAITDLRKEAPVAGASWSGAADEDIADAKFTGGHAIGIQSDTESTAVLFDSTAMRTLDAGAYVPLPRVAAISASYAATIRLFSRIGTTDTTLQTISTINTVPEYRDLAAIHLPFAATLTSTPVVALGAGVKAADATNGHEAVLDNVTLLPASWSWVGVHPSDPAAGYDSVRFTADGKVYLDDAEDYSSVVSAGPLMVEPGTAKVLIVAELASAAATVACYVTAKFTPRYHSV